MNPIIPQPNSGQDTTGFRFMAGKVPTARLAHALAKAEGFYAGQSPQVLSTNGMELPIRNK